MADGNVCSKILEHRPKVTLRRAGSEYRLTHVGGVVCMSASFHMEVR